MNRRIVELHRAFLCIVLISVALASCKHRPKQDSPPAEVGPSENPVSAEKLIGMSRSLDTSTTSVTKLRATVREDRGSARQIRLTMFRKRQPEGRRLLLVQFTDPPEERDRNGLISFDEQGNIEAFRYLQGTDTSLVTRSATSEDSLFGMTLQELVGGQIEKYDFRVTTETSVAGAAAYRLEGELKRDADSKFQRAVVYISKADSIALVLELYDNKNSLSRRLSVDRTEKIEGYWTRMHWTLENVGHAKQIDFETLEVKYNQPLSDSIFTRDHLKIISSR